MAGRTLISKLNQKNFIIRYIVLNLMTVMFVAVTLMDLSGIMLVLATLFAPMALLVFEAVITVGRLHDIDQSVNYVLVLYFKFELVKRLFYGQHDVLFIISLIVYIGFVLFLMTRKSKE